MISATVFELEGVRTDADTRAVKDRVYDVPEVGGVTFEITSERTTMQLKHKDDVTLDRSAIERAVRAAGPRYRVV